MFGPVYIAQSFGSGSYRRRVSKAVVRRGMDRVSKPSWEGYTYKLY